jgi:hypothetical protein
MRKWMIPLGILMIIVGLIIVLLAMIYGVYFIQPIGGMLIGAMGGYIIGIGVVIIVNMLLFESGRHPLFRVD